MACVYVIAGPPGIGKSTSGYRFIPDNVDILDADMIAHRYKEQGFRDYKDIGNIRYQDMIRRSLVSGEDFAIELNLGFQSHYDFIRHVKAFNGENKFHIILYYADDIMICLNRAAERHAAGLHLVSPDTIAEMYHNTFSLLTANFKIADQITLIDVRPFDEPSVCGRWLKPSETITPSQITPDWMRRLKAVLEPHLQQERHQKVQKRKLRGPRL
jgi:predicted ABC-type ATPase